MKKHIPIILILLTLQLSTSAIAASTCDKTKIIAALKIVKANSALNISRVDASYKLTLDYAKDHYEKSEKYYMNGEYFGMPDNRKACVYVEYADVEYAQSSVRLRKKDLKIVRNDNETIKNNLDVFEKMLLECLE